jgi:hypothetical protein
VVTIVVRVSSRRSDYVNKTVEGSFHGSAHSCLFLILITVVSAGAQQTLYWKRDHLYGPDGKEIAVMVPAPTDQTPPTAPTGVFASSVTVVDFITAS